MKCEVHWLLQDYQQKYMAYTRCCIVSLCNCECLENVKKREHGYKCLPSRHIGLSRSVLMHSVLFVICVWNSI